MSRNVASPHVADLLSDLLVIPQHSFPLLLLPWRQSPHLTQPFRNRITIRDRQPGIRSRAALEDLRRAPFAGTAGSEPPRRSAADRSGARGEVWLAINAPRHGVRRRILLKPNDTGGKKEERKARTALGRDVRRENHFLRPGYFHGRTARDASPQHRTDQVTRWASASLNIRMRW